MVLKPIHRSDAWMGHIQTLSNISPDATDGDPKHSSWKGLVGITARIPLKRFGAVVVVPKGCTFPQSFNHFYSFLRWLAWPASIRWFKKEPIGSNWIKTSQTSLVWTSKTLTVEIPASSSIKGAFFLLFFRWGVDLSAASWEPWIKWVRLEGMTRHMIFLSNRHWHV